MKINNAMNIRSGKIKATVNLLLVCTLLVCGPAPKAGAQDFVSDMERIRTAIKESKSLLLEIHTTIEYTADMKKDQNLPESIHTVIKVGNGMYYYQNEMVSMVINRDWVVGVMHGQKQIIYGRNDSQAMEKARKKALEKDVPTDPALAAKAQFAGEENGIRHYRIGTPGNGVKTMDMYIDTRTGFFSRLTNEYADPAKTGVIRTVTEFKQFTDRATFNNDEFSEKLFLRSTGKTMQPVEKYKTYHLLFTDPEHLNNF